MSGAGESYGEVGGDGGLADTAFAGTDGDDVGDVVTFGGLLLGGVALGGVATCEPNGEADFEGGESFAGVAGEFFDGASGLGADSLAGFGTRGGEGDGDTDGVVADGAAFDGVERDEVALELGVFDGAEGGEDVVFGKGHRCGAPSGKLAQDGTHRGCGVLCLKLFLGIERGDLDGVGGETFEFHELAGVRGRGDHAVEAEGDSPEFGGDEDFSAVSVEVVLAVFEADVIKVEGLGVHAPGGDDAHAVGGAVEEHACVAFFDLTRVEASVGIFGAAGNRGRQSDEECGNEEWAHGEPPSAGEPGQGGYRSYVRMT